MIFRWVVTAMAGSVAQKATASKGMPLFHLLHQTEMNALAPASAAVWAAAVRTAAAARSAAIPAAPTSATSAMRWS
jgi:hypothetical protein